MTASKKPSSKLHKSSVEELLEVMYVSNSDINGGFTSACCDISFRRHEELVSMSTIEDDRKTCVGEHQDIATAEHIIIQEVATSESNQY